MGCFAQIRFCCPSCGKEIYAQSKSGDCCMQTYEIGEVPLSAAYDAHLHAPFNCVCGKSWQFEEIPYQQEPMLKLKVEVK